MPSPVPPAHPDLLVDPALLADAGRHLRLITGGGGSWGAHARGPRPTPDSGDDGCTAAYARAAHQLAGLISAAVVRNDALGGALGRAAALYVAIDGAGLGSPTRAGLGGDAA